MPTCRSRWCPTRRRARSSSRPSLLAAPSPFKTPDGVGIGSTRAEIVAVYGRYLGHTNDVNEVLVGSVYFGMLFTLEDERVSGIFLGAMAF